MALAPPLPSLPPCHFDMHLRFNLPAEAALMFGRGMRAGIDRREQKKSAAVLEAELMRKVRGEGWSSRAFHCTFTFPAEFRGSGSVEGRGDLEERDLERRGFGGRRCRGEASGDKRIWRGVI